MTKAPQSAPFAAEIATYEANKTELLKTHAGKFVLIHDKEIVEVFDSETNALQAGYQRFGPVPLFIQQILPEEKVQSAPALTFGILSMA